MDKLSETINGIKYIYFEAKGLDSGRADKMVSKLETYKGILNMFSKNSGIWETTFDVGFLIPEQYAYIFGTSSAKS